MPKTTAAEVAPTNLFTVHESHALTGVHPFLIAYLVDNGIVPAEASSTSNGITKLDAVGVSVVKFIEIRSLSIFSMTYIKRTTRVFWRYARSNWHTLITDPSNAPEFYSKEFEFWEHFEKSRIDNLFRELASALMRLEWAKGKVVEDPNVRGGLPTIRGSRVSVYEIVDILNGDGMEICLDTFIALNAKDIEAADIYAKAIPRQSIPGPGRGLIQLVKTGELRLLRTTRVHMPRQVAPEKDGTGDH